MSVTGASETGMWVWTVEGPRRAYCHGPASALGGPDQTATLNSQVENSIYNQYLFKDLNTYRQPKLIIIGWHNVEVIASQSWRSFLDTVYIYKFSRHQNVTGIAYGINLLNLGSSTM